MKQIILSFLTTVFFALTIHAQGGLLPAADSVANEVEEIVQEAADEISTSVPEYEDYPINIELIEEPMNVGVVPAYQLNITSANQKLIEKVWSDYVKEKGAKAKLNRKTKELEVQDFVIPEASIASKVYSTFSNLSEEGSITSVFEVAPGEYVDASDADLDAAVRDMYVDFAKKVRVQGITDELEAEEKIMKEYEKELSNLKRDKDRLEKEIRKCRGDIKQAERDIEKNVLDKEKTLVVLNGDPDNPNYTVPTDSKQIKKLRKELKKLENEEARLYKKIQKCQDTIRENEAALPVNKQEQIGASQKIELQREVVKVVQQRLAKAMKM